MKNGNKMHTKEPTRHGEKRPVMEAFRTPELLSTLRAFKKGDFTARIATHYSGVAGEIAELLNDCIERNQAVARELARVSSVVGKEGKLSQRASLRDAGGDWASAIESINELIADLVQPTTEV